MDPVSLVEIQGAEHEEILADVAYRGRKRARVHAGRLEPVGPARRLWVTGFGRKRPALA